MLITNPQIGDRHRRLLDARLDSIERLVEEAERITAIEVVIVVEEQLDHIAVGVLAGDDAVVEVAEVAKWATWFLAARPWVPLLIIDMGDEATVTLARCLAPERETAR